MSVVPFQRQSALLGRPLASPAWAVTAETMAGPENEVWDSTAAIRSAARAAFSTDSRAPK